MIHKHMSCYCNKTCLYIWKNFNWTFSRRRNQARTFTFICSFSFIKNNIFYLYTVSMC
uniref:hypothetical protein n=1 Tax=Batrachospermum sp. TaxID=31373 RepID=UPI001FA6AFF0|nr:hypothetical protein MRV80_mgp11 [Batrachospermum sp.]UNB13421.1 hypothetical protein [Batrachospermum sp.]